MIVDGWFDFAQREPGPPEKQYPEICVHRGVVCHSMAGMYPAALARMLGPDRASWKGSILYDGTLIQHYPMDASCWTSGSPEANISFDAFETEGAQPILFTQRQLETWARIIGELSEAYGWTPRRPTDGNDLAATCWEHNEMTRFGAAATACPDGRADWGAMMKEEDMSKPLIAWVPGWGVFFINGGAHYIAKGEVVTELAQLYGISATPSVALSADAAAALGGK